MKSGLLALIRFYQRSISPSRPPACRFLPTCSQYAFDAIETRGAMIGVALGAWRVVRCNPFNDGGYDPVPLRPSTNHRHSPR
jgi:putative membrane protein insertion efficiency factor